MRRSKISAVKIKEGTEYNLTLREWDRWCDTVSGARKARRIETDFGWSCVLGV